MDSFPRLFTRHTFSSQQIPFEDYRVGSPDDRDPDDYDSGGGDPGDTSGDGRGEGEAGREPSPEEAQSSFMITASSSFLAVRVRTRHFLVFGATRLLLRGLSPMVFVAFKQKQVRALRA